MPMATVTTRQLKNKDTGIDISVPTYEEIPGLLTKTIEFQLTVVTNLAVFKLPKHKETDVVQYVVGKKFNDFEDLYLLLNEKFSGIAFPALPKKVLITTDDVNKDRRAALDNLMKFFSKTPRIANCPLLLEFLGASPSQVLRADSLIIKDKSDDSIDSGVSPSRDFVEDKKSPSDESDIFGEDEDEPSGDPFSDIKPEPFLERKNTEADLFGDGPEHKPYKMFKEPDYSGEMSKEDELLFKKGHEEASKVSPIHKALFDDTDSLLNVEDDLDQLLRITKKSKRAPKLGAHGTDGRPKSSISLSSPDRDVNLPSSAADFMKYIEENTSRDDVDLFS